MKNWKTRKSLKFSMILMITKVMIFIKLVKPSKRSMLWELLMKRGMHSIKVVEDASLRTG